jgi:hypothetical protein
MQDKQASSEKPRRHYSKPEIRRVELQPQECLAAGCKTLSIVAPGATGCDTNSCSDLGS